MPGSGRRTPCGPCHRRGSFACPFRDVRPRRAAEAERAIPALPSEVIDPPAGLQQHESCTHDLDTLADDVAALLDHLDLRGITLVGHSLGTAEIVRMLGRHGSGRVARIALVAGMTPGPVRSADHAEGLAPSVIEEANAAFRRDRLGFFADGAEAFFALQRPGNELSQAYVRHMVDRCSGATARAATAMGDLLVTMNLAPELAKIDVPALVVHGTHDVSAPLDLTGRRTAALLPGSAFHVYEDAGHGLFATHAEQLNADLRQFMSRQNR